LAYASAHSYATLPRLNLTSQMSGEVGVSKVASEPVKAEHA
jgi:hypothetical protein